MPRTSGATAADAGTVDIGGDITVNRLGFGAMRIGPTPRGERGRRWPASRRSGDRSPYRPGLRTYGASRYYGVADGPRTPRDPRRPEPLPDHLVGRPNRPGSPIRPPGGLLAGPGDFGITR
jgi:hypothetical protein